MNNFHRMITAVIQIVEGLVILSTLGYGCRESCWVLSYICWTMDRQEAKHARQTDGQRKL